MSAAESAAAPARFRDREVVFANGIAGRNVAIRSANPVNYFQMVSRPAEMPPVEIDGKLFLPKAARGKLPLVIVVPGSLSVAPTHLGHAETFTDMGIAAFVLDPFGGRGVTSTVANQTQFSFAASAYDVIVTARHLASLPEIDAMRIGLQGHSRGGAAVLGAAMRRFNAPVLGKDLAIRAVLAGYPWCGHQLLDPDIGTTEVRVLIGDRDEWCSPQQAQGHVQAMRLRGGTASIRIFSGAAHSFDRNEPLRKIDNASVAPAAPTGYIADDGALIHPVVGVPDPKLVDRDIAVYGIKAGYGAKGATIGSEGDLAAQFRADMIAFFQRTLLG
ncbi:MAG TPA: prolyl oligopeptidase family serine peptidase [Vineibacter sp.]|nr:prolyl oligopeptidase family serine peptidase [Vineibacter sp.]